MANPFKKIKSLFDKLLLSHATPKEVSQSFALGLFVSMLPVPGQTFIVIFLIALLKKNELAGLVAVWVTNPLTIVPVAIFNYKVGKLFYPPAKSHFAPTSFSDFLNLSGDLLIPLWIGGIIVGLCAGTIGYFLALKFYPLIQEKRRQLKRKIHENF